MRFLKHICINMSVQQSKRTIISVSIANLILKFILLIQTKITFFSLIFNYVDAQEHNFFLLRCF